MAPETKERTRILFICGSLNQTTQMHQIAQSLPEYDHAFTPFYTDGTLELLRRRGMAEFTILGGAHLQRTNEYLCDHGLPIDYRGASNIYDLVVRCADIIVPKNTRGRRSVLVQEGMTDPRNVRFYLIKYFGIIPRWMASTATFGMSDDYDRFCVASEGYRDHFVRNGIAPDKIVVTGIPNFDNCKRYLRNDFPHRHFVLACTSDMRETMRYENRPKFIKQCTEIAAGRQLIFKLHPNENAERAVKEIAEYAPGALVFSKGSAEEMVANCDVLVSRYSSVVFVASALGKEVYCDLDPDHLHHMTPLQNGNSAAHIAGVCRDVLAMDEHARIPVNPWRIRKEGLKHDLRVLAPPAKRKEIRFGA